MSAAATPSLACPQLAEPRACAASQYGGVLYVRGEDDSAIAVTISNGVIINCSAVAGGGYGVRARHAAQRGPSLGVLGEGRRVAYVWLRRGREHAAGAEGQGYAHACGVSDANEC